MWSTIYRTLEGAEVDEARRLSNCNPDVFSAYALDRLPCVFEIAGSLEPASDFRAKQRLILGAFQSDRIVGALFIESVDRLAEIETSKASWDIVLSRFTEHEVNVYRTLVADWGRAMIGAPDGSLSIHSLCVAREHRQKGIATALLREAVDRLRDDERSSLYIEVARIRSYRRLCESAGFRIVSKRLSLSDRLQFGCWGTALFKFAPTDLPTN